DMIDSPLRNDIMADTVEYEAESWSLAVEPEFCSKQEKSIIKRQDVIYVVRDVFTLCYLIRIKYYKIFSYFPNMIDVVYLSSMQADTSLYKIDNKTFARLKKGNFRKHDLMNRKRVLHHEGVVFWKTATGRLKDILALLLTDVLIFLQEKDQKYVFAAVDQKPPVIPLQKLIVREVANEERGMFLISASTSGPEMYEIHTNTKEERNTWMRLIREAVESCPQEEDKEGETEEDRQMAEARIQKIHKYQESLHSHDEQICQSLEEKLNIYSKLTALNFPCQPVQEQHLLIKPDPEEVPQAAALLTTAIKEGESICFKLKFGMSLQNITV
ncbi:ARG28 factor, partial [Polypterus senegalus]|nr:ARG28 factor [Polypterus senegalus]